MIPDNSTKGVLDLVGWLMHYVSTPFSKDFSKRAEAIAKWIIGAVFAGSAAAAYKNVDSSSPDFLRTIAIVSISEVILLALMMTLILSVGIDNHEVKEGKETVEQLASMQFRRALWALCLMWGVQYSLLASHDFVLHGACRSSLETCHLKFVPALAVCSDIANYLTSFIFLILYVILAKRTAAKGDRPEARILFGFLLGAIGIGFSIYAFVKSEYPFTTIAQPFVLIGGQRPWWEKAADTYNGLYGGMTMALVFARIESRYIGLRGTVAALLFLYALIQPVYDLLPDGGYIRLTLLFSALMLKMLFLTACAWALHEGRLTFYMGQLRYVADNMGEIMSSWTASASSRLPIRAATSNATFEFKGDSHIKVCGILRNVDISVWYLQDMTCEHVKIQRSGETVLIDVLDVKLKKPKPGERLASSAGVTEFELQLQPSLESKELRARLLHAIQLEGLRLVIRRADSDPVEMRLLDLGDRELSWNPPAGPGSAPDL